MEQFPPLFGSSNGINANVSTNSNPNGFVQTNPFQQNQLNSHNSSNNFSNVANNSVPNSNSNGFVQTNPFQQNQINTNNMQKPPVFTTPLQAMSNLSISNTQNGNTLPPPPLTSNNTVSNPLPPPPTQMLNNATPVTSGNNNLSRYPASSSIPQKDFSQDQSNPPSQSRPQQTTSQNQAAQKSQKINPSQMPSPTAQESNTVKYVTSSMATPPPATSQYVVVDDGNCSPRFMRMTLYNIPQTADLLKSSALPLAAVIRPLAEVAPGEVILKNLKKKTFLTSFCNRRQSLLLITMLMAALFAVVDAEAI
jgi:hypothetical protein